METIDCRGLSCPAPVITVKNTLKDHGVFRVLLDDGAPHENVLRFSRNRGCLVAEEREGAGWLLTITAPTETEPAARSAATTGARVLLVTSDRLGDGPEELGRLLMRNFIHTLLETREPPARILFMNRGVFLSCEGSELLEALDKLGGMGVEVFSCGLCLDFFGLKEKLRAGVTTNMLATVESLLSSGLVIKL